MKKPTRDVPRWSFQPPPPAALEQFAVQDVYQAAHTAATEAAAEVALNGRLTPLQSRAAFADHSKTRGAMNALRARIADLRQEGPRIGDATERREPSLHEVWFSEEVTPADRAELLELGRAARADKTVLAAVLAALTRRDPNEHERRMQIVFLRTSLAPVFGPDGVRAHAALHQRLHTPVKIEGLEQRTRAQIRRATTRCELQPFMVWHDRELNETDRLDLSALAAAAREDRSAQSEILALLTRRDPNEGERRLQSAFLRSSPGLFGADGVRAHAALLKRLQDAAVAELDACLSLQAEIVRAGDPQIVQPENPSDWYESQRSWFASAGKLKEIEARLASAIQEARTHAPCPRCRGDGSWRGENGSGWTSCPICYGTGSADKEVISRAPSFPGAQHAAQE